MSMRGLRRWCEGRAGCACVDKRHTLFYGDVQQRAVLLLMQCAALCDTLQCMVLSWIIMHMLLIHVGMSLVPT
jgi:hypothetical protein